VCMSMKICGIALLLFVALLLVGTVVAEDTTIPAQGANVVPATQAQVDAANKYLSAEVAKQIQTSSASMLKQMQDYQDENFRIFDGRMQQLMDDGFTKAILGGFGAMLLASGIVAYILTKYFKTYSYEKYQEKIIGQQQEQLQARGQELQAMREMQQPEWEVQRPQETVGMRYGQSWASDMTAMNQWQAQPAYDGAWRAPIETKPEFSKSGEPQSAESENPMGMPEWLRRG